MRTSRLIQLLKTLRAEDKELQKFEKYLKAKYANSNLEVVELLAYLKRFAPSYTSTRLKRATICKHAFDSPKRAEVRLNKLAHHLKETLEDFLVQYELTQNELLKKQLLLQALKNRNHPDYANQSKKLITALNPKKEISVASDKYLSLFQLNDALWSDINTEKFGSDESIFQNANKYLDKFYFIEKLKIILEYNTLQNIRASSFELPQVDKMLALIKASPEFKDDATLTIFLLALQMVQSSKKADYLKLKKSFFEFVQCLPKRDAQVILLLLNNYYNKHLGEDQIFYANEGFELFRFADKHSLLVENNRIRDIEYANAATVGFFNKEDDWTFAFVKKYKPFLAPQIKDATYAQVIAYYHFRQRDYNGVIELLTPFAQTDNLPVGTNTKIKTLLLRALFELWNPANDTLLKMQDLLKSRTESFERYIIGHSELAPNKKQNYLQFTTHLKKVIQVNGTNKERLKKLLTIQQNLKHSVSVTLRNWLQPKIQKMIADLSF